MVYYERVNKITIFNITKNVWLDDINNIFVKNFTDRDVAHCKWIKCDNRLCSVTCDGINFINVKNIDKKYTAFKFFDKYILLKYKLYFSIYKIEYGTELCFIQKYEYDFDVNDLSFKIGDNILCISNYIDFIPKINVVDLTNTENSMTIDVSSHNIQFIGAIYFNYTSNLLKICTLFPQTEKDVNIDISKYRNIEEPKIRLVLPDIII